MKNPSTGHRLWTDDLGQDLIEYAMIATFISLMACFAAAALNSAVANLYTKTAAQATRGANFSTQSSASTSAQDCPKDQPENPACK